MCVECYVCEMCIVMCELGRLVLDLGLKKIIVPQVSYHYHYAPVRFIYRGSYMYLLQCS
jgi:hypothetical protein